MGLFWHSDLLQRYRRLPVEEAALAVYPAQHRSGQVLHLPPHRHRILLSSRAKAAWPCLFAPVSIFLSIFAAQKILEQEELHFPLELAEGILVRVSVRYLSVEDRGAAPEPFGKSNVSQRTEEKNQ